MHRRKSSPSRIPATRRSRGAAIEALESRQLLSASALAAGVNVDHGIALPTLSFAPSAVTASVGYTPAQVRHAYGFDLIKFGSVSGSGTGQTIALVDAYHDPSVAGDLAVFDSHFGLADPPSFKEISQTGGATTAGKANSKWSAEVALDVEWTHAIAPQAGILLVEANSDGLTDLLAATNTARHQTGVSVVSLSWGAGEFYGEQNYDSTFTTPKGHASVSFVAASGDMGSSWGPEWPASSPNVISVGGTSLHLGNTAGAYGSETAWSSTTGGTSSLENEPTYQSKLQTDGRSSPDVAYNADPYTGFAVYDSVPDQGHSGWSAVGGTSAGSPQWAALIAIADQGRAINHLSPLDGAGATLPDLYKLYSAASYPVDFHDVTRSNAAPLTDARSGYDFVTGLGSPHANQIISALVGATSPVIVITPPPGTKSTGGVTTNATPAEMDWPVDFSSRWEGDRAAPVDDASASGAFPVFPPFGNPSQFDVLRAGSPVGAPSQLHDFIRADMPVSNFIPTHVAAHRDVPSAVPTQVTQAATAPRTSANAIGAAPTVAFGPPAAAASPVSADVPVPTVTTRAAKSDASPFSAIAIQTASIAAAPFTLARTEMELVARAVAGLIPEAVQAAEFAEAGAPADASTATTVTALATSVIANANVARATTAARAFFNIAPINATAMFSDALATFAGDCAALPQAPKITTNTRRAWTITAIVLAADVMLFGRWQLKRRQAKKSRLPFRDGTPLANAF